MDNIYKNFTTGHGCPAKMDYSQCTDYRSANTRESHNKHKNNIHDEDEYRMFLQNNATTIMNNTWTNLNNKSCKPSVCVHNQFQTRMSPGQFYDQITLHDDVRTGKIVQNDLKYPVCKKYDDYRATY